MLNKEICLKCNSCREEYGANSDEEFNKVWIENNEVWCIGLLARGPYLDTYGYVSKFISVENLPNCPYYLEQLLSNGTLL